MVKTCHFCHGHSNDFEEANLRRCSGCRKVYYCSVDCQKCGWIEHIFDCKPRRPINTADFLARAVWRNIFPEHRQTCEDYGFDRAVTEEEKINLFGLYIGLIKFRRIPPKTIHDWRVRGVLVDEIKATFYKISEGSRGGYFPWFLQNQHIIALAGQPLPEQALQTLRNDAGTMMVRAWKFIGGSETDSPDEISAALERKPEEERDSHCLYTLLLSKVRPTPLLDLWVDFGFISCTSEDEEVGLCAQYRALIMKCTFKEFCDAYRTGGLFDLFRSKGLELHDRYGHLRDLLQVPPGCKKSVWHLKQFVLHGEDTSEEEFRMHRAVTVDYGFFNCRNDSERRQLVRVYKAFFNKHDGDPLALHEAAVEGNLNGYLSKVVEGLRDPKFRRLMKNPYPLPSPDMPV